MSLTTCPECQTRISTSATSCPQCGYRRPRNVRGVLVLVLVGVLMAGAGVLAWYSSDAQRAKRRANDILECEQLAPPDRDNWEEFRLCLLNVKGWDANEAAREAVLRGISR
jgi:hypothetical protein